MMPFSKEKNRRIYIAALVISFLLIVGSIFLHLKQKTHLGRMSFNLDLDRVKPTSGVVTANSMANSHSDQTDIQNDSDESTVEASSPEDDDDDVTIHYTNSRQYESDNNEEHYKNNDADIDDIIDDILHKNSNEYEIKSLEQNSNACLRCLCMTMNVCRPTFCGSGNPCGLYRISKLYWIESGKPTIAGGSTDNEDQDYLTCVNDDTCSTTVIRQYYNRYKRDCNKDGKFDCLDQIALHLLGPSGCLEENLSYIHANRMKNCLIESNLNYFSYSSEEEQA